MKIIDVKNLELSWKIKTLERSKLGDDFVDYISKEKEEYSKPLSIGEMVFGCISAIIIIAFSILYSIIFLNSLFSDQLNLLDVNLLIEMIPNFLIPFLTIIFGIGFLYDYFFRKEPHEHSINLFKDLRNNNQLTEFIETRYSEKKFVLKAVDLSWDLEWYNNFIFDQTYPIFTSSIALCSIFTIGFLNLKQFFTIFSTLTLQEAFITITFTYFCVGVSFFIYLMVFKPKYWGYSQRQPLNRIAYIFVAISPPIIVFSFPSLISYNLFLIMLIIALLSTCLIFLSYKVGIQVFKYDKLRKFLLKEQDLEYQTLVLEKADSSTLSLNRDRLTYFKNLSLIPDSNMFSFLLKIGGILATFGFSVFQFL